MKKHMEGYGNCKMKKSLDEILGMHNDDYCPFLRIYEKPLRCTRTGDASLELALEHLKNAEAYCVVPEKWKKCPYRNIK